MHGQIFIFIGINACDAPRCRLPTRYDGGRTTHYRVSPNRYLIKFTTFDKQQLETTRK